MKTIFTIFAAVLTLATVSSCKKEKMHEPKQPTTTTTVVINNIVTVNGVTTTTSDTITITNPGGGNTGGGGTNQTPVYVGGVVTPNSSFGSLAIGETYWGFTSVPAACGASAYDEVCNPIAIKITGIAANGRYTYTAYPTVTFASQNGFYPYIPSDNYGGSMVKNSITSALLMENYPFVIVTF